MDCHKSIDSEDFLYYEDGKRYERSLKCWGCRTPRDRKAIKDFRRTHKQTNPQ